MEQNRLKSYVVWASVLAQIISILQFTGILRRYGLDAGVLGDIGAGILQILVLFGVLNNPTNKTRF